MAERKVVGTDVLLFLDLAGGTAYDLVVCLTNNTYNATVQEIDAKSKCGPDKLPGTVSFEASFEGQIIIDPAPDRVGIAALYTALTGKTTVGWKIGKVTPVTGDTTYTGTAFISKLDQSFGEDAPSTFSASLGIYGSPVQTVTA